MKRIVLPQIESCDGCGACCTGQEALPVGYYLGNLGDRSALPPALVAELEAFAERFDREGWPGNGEPCVWYDADRRRCRHYEHRPDICHDLEVGGEGCRSWRRSLGIDPAARFGLVNGRLVRRPA